MGLEFAQEAGSPALLNSTPTTFTDAYALVYVADRYAVSGGTDDGWFAVMKPMAPHTGANPAPRPPVPVYLVDESGNQLIDEAGNRLIAEDYS